jgi:hypothetical protein
MRVVIPVTRETVEMILDVGGAKVSEVIKVTSTPAVGLSLLEGFCPGSTKTHSLGVEDTGRFEPATGLSPAQRTDHQPAKGPYLGMNVPAIPTAVVARPMKTNTRAM